MQETRRQRLQSAIQQELSQFVPREVKDPRVSAVTFTDVQVTLDGSHATILVSLLGGFARNPDGTPIDNQKITDARMKGCLEGLKAASGYIRRHLGTILTIRHIPSLTFKEDRGFENVSRVHELLRKLDDEKKEEPPSGE